MIQFPKYYGDLIMSFHEDLKEQAKKTAIATTIAISSLTPANAQSQENTPNNNPKIPQTEHTISRKELTQDLKEQESSFKDYSDNETYNYSIVLRKFLLH